MDGAGLLAAVFRGARWLLFSAFGIWALGDRVMDVRSVYVWLYGGYLHAPDDGCGSWRRAACGTRTLADMGYTYEVAFVQQAVQAAMGNRCLELRGHALHCV